jgi:hypothetical protein
MLCSDVPVTVASRTRGRYPRAEITSPCDSFACIKPLGFTPNTGGKTSGTPYASGPRAFLQSAEQRRLALLRGGEMLPCSPSTDPSPEKIAGLLQ